MSNYIKLVLSYHKRYFVIYLSVFLTICLFYYFQLPTPISILLKPFGLHSWSSGLTRACIAFLHLNFKQAYSYNHLFFFVVGVGLFHFLFSPILERK